MNEPTRDPFAGAYPDPRVVGLAAPLRWVRRGAGDLRRAPLASMFYGAVLAAMGWLLVRNSGSAAVGLALLTGFLLVGPLLATGLYAISRALERGDRPEFRRSLVAWRDNLTSFSFFGAILALLLAVWIRVSMVVVALFFDGPPPQAGHLLRDMLAAPNGWLFVATYLAAGFGFAVLVFSASVVSLPLLLDRPRADTMTAIVTSMRVLAANPAPMLLWAAIIVVLTAIGFLTAYLGLVVLLPIVGHATWHAYRELVEPDAAADAAAGGPPGSEEGAAR
jgi:uncharacterized membrane protein